MGKPKVGSHPEIYCSIDGGPDVGPQFEKFEWKAFTNGGYVIRAKLQDSYWNILRDVATRFYLADGRRRPTQVVFEIIWPGVGSTGKHRAYMADMDARGINSGGFLEFIAIDPPSYWLNAGDSSGKVYTGKVSKVIKDVLTEYFEVPGNGDSQVSETTDDTNGKWPMMRQDPKTFIGSLLDWSSSITKHKTNWIVSSDGFIENDKPTIWIKEQADHETVNYGTYVLDTNTPAANDAFNFEFLSDNLISVFQKQIITHGMSAISGRFLDRIVDKPRKIVHTYDDNTAEKKNVSLDMDPLRSFAKPGENSSPTKPHEWSTSISSVPEFNGGELGITYDKYIDGRGRGLFLSMLNLVMRIKLRVTGEISRDLANCHNLGVSKLKIVWRDADSKAYFMDGDWLVYGFHHIVDRRNWVTDLYCARLDYDAAAQKV